MDAAFLSNLCGVFVSSRLSTHNLTNQSTEFNPFFFNSKPNPITLMNKIKNKFFFVYAVCVCLSVDALEFVCVNCTYK